MCMNSQYTTNWHLVTTAQTQLTIKPMQMDFTFTHITVQAALTL